MNLTPENKAIIDNKSLAELHDGIINLPIGNAWFEGETGSYWVGKYHSVRDTCEEEYKKLIKESEEKAREMDELNNLNRRIPEVLEEYNSLVTRRNVLQTKLEPPAITLTRSIQDRRLDPEL